MSAMPGAWLEAPSMYTQDHPHTSNEESYGMYSHVLALDDDDDTDSVSSFETCKASMYELCEPCRIYQFPSHMLPSLEHRANEFEALGPVEKRRWCYSRISFDNPARSRKKDWRHRKPLLMRHKMQSPPKEAKVEAIATEPNLPNPAMADMENELSRLREQLASTQQKLESTRQGQKFTTLRREAAELALEKAVEEHVASKEDMSAELSLAQYQVAIRDYWFKPDDKVGKLREESKAQWQRAQDAQQQVQRLEEELTNANSELQEVRKAGEQSTKLQQQLDASIETSHNADQEIQRLRSAVTTSENYAQDIHRQALERIQTLTNEASQEAQRLTELGIMTETRANQAEQENRGLQQTNEEQATLIRNLQNEGKRLENIAEDHRGQASLGATKASELERQVSEMSNRAQNAEARVKELEEKITRLEATAAKKGEANEEGEDSDEATMEAACAITSLNNRLERENDEANALLEEFAFHGMNRPSQDALDSLVKTNQVFKMLEEKFDEFANPNISEVDNILTDAMADADMRKAMEIANLPVLVRQLREAHHVRQTIDDIINDAVVREEVFLDDEDAIAIKTILTSPRTLPSAAATRSSRSPPRARQPTSSSSTTTSAPLYNHPGPQLTPTYIPGLPINPFASPTTGAPTPYNPLFNTPDPSPTSLTSPTPRQGPYPAPSALRALIPEYNTHASSPLRSEYNPHIASPASPESESEWDAEQDAEGETDDEVMPEAFEGEHDYGSDYDDDDDDDEPEPEPVVPGRMRRVIREPASRRKRRRVLDGDGDEAIFM